MSRFLTQVRALFQPDDPIYRQIRKRLSIIIGKRRLLWVTLGSIVLVFLLIGLPMSLLTPGWLVPNYDWAPAMAAAQLGLIIWQELVKQLVCFTIGILTAAVASSVTRDENQDMLYLTPYSPRQIRFSILRAVFYQFLLLLLGTLLIRSLLIILISAFPQLMGENLLWLSSILRPGFLRVPLFVQRSAGQLSHFEYDLWLLWIRQIEAITYLKVWPLWVGYYILQPIIDALLFGLAGLVVASRAQTRDGRLLGSLGVISGMWVMGYLGERLLAALIMWAYNSYANLRWFVGVSAMDSGYINVWNLFATMMGVIIIIKLLLSGMLLRAINHKEAYPNRV